MPTDRNLFWLVLLLFLGTAWFSNIQCRDLLREDEGRYAEIPREMVATGDWLTPHLDGFKYFEKPPLQYWATATAYQVFGRHNWTARLWTYLTGFAGIVLVFGAGSRLFGRQAGGYGALALVSSFYYGVLARVNTLDTGLTFFLTGTLVCFLLAQQEGIPVSIRRRWMLLSWLSTALAVLSKGLVGVVLPGGALVLYTLIQKDWGLWRRLHIPSGLTLFVLVAAPWFVLVSLKNPQFFHFFFIREHFARYLTRVHHRYQPWWFFIPILSAGFFPWISQFLKVWASEWRSHGSGGAFDSRRFLWVWTATILVFFSFSDSKLIPYIEPLFPPLALLIGIRLAEPSRSGLKWNTLLSGLMALAGFFFFFFVGLTRFARPVAPAPLFEAANPWVLAGLTILLVGTGVGWGFLQVGRLHGTIWTLGITWFLAVHLWFTGSQALAPSYSSRLLADQVRPHLSNGAPFYSLGKYPQTLPFYLNRTLTPVGFTGELGFGIGQSPERWVPDISSFEARWQKEKEAFAVMPPDLFHKLRQQGLPMKEIGRDPRRVAVKKP
jgi:4-amino-4-deoxy-L-arabinose transferase-like glycosyltransferase